MGVIDDPTFEASMEELQLACGQLVIALAREAVKPVIGLLRFILWLNG